MVRQLRREAIPLIEPVDDNQLAADATFMRRAIELAERGWGRVSPNPLVGAVVVRDGQIVGEGWHTEFGLPHAEVEALRAAGDLAFGATLYVTLEPCAHRGKTPPCTEALLAAGVSRLVFACDDADPVAIGGADVLRAHGLAVTAGVEEERARRINGPFFRRHSPSARLPWLELKLALTLDGKLADRAGHSNWITGDVARAEVHRLRAGHDAIAVGAGTALADDPTLTVRGAVKPRVPPERIVFDRRLRLPATGRLAQSAREVPVRVITALDAPAGAREELESLGVRVLTSTSLREGLEALFAQSVSSIFCEGGAEIASALLREELVDRLTLFQAPLLLGPGAVDPFAALPSPLLEEARRWKLVRAATFGEDTLLSVER